MLRRLDHAGVQIAGARGAAVDAVLVEVAVRAQELDQPVGVGRIERRIDLVRGETLRQQLRHEAARVGHVFAIAHRFAAEHRVVLHPRVVVVVHERRERNVELAAVVEQALVRARNTRGTRVQIQIGIVIERADLRIAEFVHLVAVAQRQIASAGAMRRLEHRALVPGAAEFVSGDQSRDAGAEYQNGAPAARRRQRGARGTRETGNETERGTESIHRGRSTGRANGHEQPAPRPRRRVGSIGGGHRSGCSRRRVQFAQRTDLPVASRPVSYETVSSGHSVPNASSETWTMVSNTTRVDRAARSPCSPRRRITRTRGNVRQH